jgi:hypothetical protein
MIFDPQKALNDWKKAKPLLLTDTGVSGVLRALPAKPKQNQLKLYVTAVTQLQKAIADPKIQKEKKALACLQTIQAGIKQFLANIHNERQESIKAFKGVCQVIAEFSSGVGSKLPTMAQVRAFDTKWRVAKREWNELYDMAAVPETHREQIKGSFYCLDKGTQGLIGSLEEIEWVKEQVKQLAKNAANSKTAKPVVQPKPRWDIKTEVGKDMALLKRSSELLKGTANSLAGLNP